MLELTEGTMNVWPADGQLSVISSTVKYFILHKIGISNRYPSSYASTISTILANLIYLVGASSPIDVGQFVFNHILRHVEILVSRSPFVSPAYYVVFFLHNILFFSLNRMLLVLLIRLLPLIIAYFKDLMFLILPIIFVQREG